MPIASCVFAFETKKEPDYYSVQKIMYPSTVQKMAMQRLFYFDEQAVFALI
jgi:hypothetical protein